MLVDFDEAFVRAELKRRFGPENSYELVENISLDAVTEALREILKPPFTATVVGYPDGMARLGFYCQCLEDWTDGGTTCHQCGLERSRSTDAL